MMTSWPAAARRCATSVVCGAPPPLYGCAGPISAILTGRSSPADPHVATLTWRRSCVAAGADDQVGQQRQRGEDHSGHEDQQGVVGEVHWVHDQVVDALEHAEAEQEQGRR